MGPGSRNSSASSNSNITSRKMAEIRLGTTVTPTPQPEATTSATSDPPILASTRSSVPSPSTRTSVVAAPPRTQRRVRGPTLGKRVRRLIDSKDGTRLPVNVTQEMRTFCGQNATKVANELGSQIRRMCLPTANSFSHSWSSVPAGLKIAIIQAVRDKFEVTEDDVEFTPLVEEVFEHKASLLYKDWKWRMRPSSLSSRSSSNSAWQELQKVQSEMELLREERRREREEYERRWEEERNRRDKEQRQWEEQQRQRDEELRQRDEQRQREFDELKAMMMRQMHGRDNV